MLAGELRSAFAAGKAANPAPAITPVGLTTSRFDDIETEGIELTVEFSKTRAVISAAAALLLAACHGLAANYTLTIEGSSPTDRQQTDQYVASVYIYTGGSFPARTVVTDFQYLFGFGEFGNTTGYITPLLFEAESSGEYTIYTVRGIGEGFEVALNPTAQKLPFDVVDGTKVTTNAKYTFGWVNALVDSTGTPSATSMGCVEFDNPADGGQGQGGSSTTNDWVASISQNTVVSLGATFGVAGSGARNLLFSGYRTYSARAGGVVVAP
jgi:hypothetical protein